VIIFDSRYVMGRQRVNEIAKKEYVEEKNISLVIFENELAFTQLRISKRKKMQDNR